MVVVCGVVCFYGDEVVVVECMVNVLIYIGYFYVGVLVVDGLFVVEVVVIDNSGEGKWVFVFFVLGIF